MATRHIPKVLEPCRESNGSARPAALELIWPASESSSRAARRDGGPFPTPMKVGQNHTTLIQFEAGKNPTLNNMRRILTYSDPKSCSPTKNSV